ncbi:hypothetical protein KKB18_05625 [bacterium]|nr:hypothetical protein [bacterium]
MAIRHLCDTFLTHFLAVFGSFWQLMAVNGSNWQFNVSSGYENVNTEVPNWETEKGLQNKGYQQK